MFQGQLNRTQIKVNIISASADHKKPVEVKFYGNAILDLNIDEQAAVFLPKDSDHRNDCTEEWQLC